MPNPPPNTIDQAYEVMRLALIESLVDNAINANIAGQVKAGLLMKMPLNFELVSSRAVAAVQPYKLGLIEGGGSDIQGKFVPWLDDMIRSERERVAAIVESGIREGTALKDISKKLDGVFVEAQHNAQLTAFQETKRLYTRGTFERYKEERIQQLEWVHLDPQENPREEHQALNGQVFDIDDPIWNELEAYNCHCSARPVLNLPGVG